MIWQIIKWPVALVTALGWGYRDVAKFLGESKSWGNLVCRLRGHPNGQVYYNPGGLEPDDRCVDCGERI